MKSTIKFFPCLFRFANLPCGRIQEMGFYYGTNGLEDYPWERRSVRIGLLGSLLIIIAALNIELNIHFVQEFRLHFIHLMHVW